MSPSLEGDNGERAVHHRSALEERLHSGEERKVYDVLCTQSCTIIARQPRLFSSYAHVLQILLCLQICCNHPSLVLVFTIPPLLPLPPPPPSLVLSLSSLGMPLLIVQLASDEDAAPATDVDNRAKDDEALRRTLPLSTNDECCFCLDAVSAPVITPCAHLFWYESTSPAITSSISGLVAVVSA